MYAVPSTRDEPLPRSQGGTPDTAVGGYLSGALLITRISDLGLKVGLYQIGLVVAVVSTVLMGYTTEVWLWFVLRFISGLSTSAGMLLGAGLLMSWLIKNNQKSELGVFFSGIGLGIVLTAIVAELIKDPFSWDQQWVIYGLVALVLLIPAWHWMLAPAVVGYLADVEGNYTNGLWLTLIVMALGVVVLHLARKTQQREHGAPALARE